jgi:acetyltransferase-like isoleucine patch superfamily enzyme
MKLLIKFELIKRSFVFKFKGQILKFYLQIHGCKVGSGLKCKQFPIFRSIPNANIEIGNNVNFGYNISLDVSSGKLKIGNNVNLTQDIVISSIKAVSIDNDTLIAENVSIRDGDHQFVLGKTINSQGLDADEIRIGKDVWIAAGVRVLKGSNLQNGCIIAANAVVKKKNITEENSIYAGIPIKEISKRK